MFTIISVATNMSIIKILLIIKMFATNILNN